MFNDQSIKKGLAVDIIDSLNMPLALLGKRGKVLHLNSYLEALLHIDRSHIIKYQDIDISELGKVLTGKLPSSKQVKQVIKNKDYHQETIKILAPNHDFIYLHVELLPIIGPETSAMSLLKMHDISAEKIASKARSEFIALTSHQLRTPLSAIKWYLDILEKRFGDNLTDQQREIIENVFKANDKMINMVDTLLNVAKVESGRIELSTIPIDFADLIKSVIDELQPKITEKNIELVSSIHTNLPKVKVDPDLIRFVFLNLIMNAIKYSDVSSEVDVFLSANETNLIVQVTDFGKGIPHADQKHIFERFYRAENVKKDEPTGTGLGLYLAKIIVESSGGKIWFDSTEGKGTTFWFTVPHNEKNIT